MIVFDCGGLLGFPSLLDQNPDYTEPYDGYRIMTEIVGSLCYDGYQTYNVTEFLGSLR